MSGVRAIEKRRKVGCEARVISSGLALLAPDRLITSLQVAGRIGGLLVARCKFNLSDFVHFFFFLGFFEHSGIGDLFSRLWSPLWRNILGVCALFTSRVRVIALK